MIKLLLLGCGKTARKARTMIRNPVLDFFTGAALAMGGPMAFMLPQRIFMEMLTAGMGPHHEPAPAEKSRRTAV